MLQQFRQAYLAIRYRQQSIHLREIRTQSDRGAILWYNTGSEEE